MISMPGFITSATSTSPLFAAEEQVRREKEGDWDPLGDVKVDGDSVKRLYQRCKGFLLWRLHGRAGRDIFCNFVTAETFRTWARILMLSIINQLNARSSDFGAVLSGWNSQQTDGLRSYARQVCCDGDRRREAASQGPSQDRLWQERSCAGPRPGALKIHYTHVLQQALALQFCLNFGKCLTSDVDTRLILLAKPRSHALALFLFSVRRRTDLHLHAP